MYQLMFSTIGFKPFENVVRQELRFDVHAQAYVQTHAYMRHADLHTTLHTFTDCTLRPDGGLVFRL